MACSIEIKATGEKNQRIAEELVREFLVNRLPPSDYQYTFRLGGNFAGNSHRRGMHMTGVPVGRMIFLRSQTGGNETRRESYLIVPSDVDTKQVVAALRQRGNGHLVGETADQLDADLLLEEEREDLSEAYDKLKRKLDRINAHLVRLAGYESDLREAKGQVERTLNDRKYAEAAVRLASIRRRVNRDR